MKSCSPWRKPRRLRDPKTLERQIQRMIADPKSQALVTNFAGQWLHIRNLRSATPDKNDFPNFDHTLRQAFERELELFVGSIIREKRSVLELLTADYTFVNERLALHYGIPNIYGSHFRRVSGIDETRRGLLGKGGILLVTSHADRTSPVVRGKWILDNLVGSPPPPPPPEVPRASGCSGREAADDARADGTASGKPGLRELPQADGSAGAGAREFRCRGRVAHRR